MGIRLILDTNLWSYVAEGGEAEALEALEDDLGLKVVIPPSMLLEVLATPREDVRARIVGVIAKPRRSRIHPLPEARLEADEITAVIRRLRPEWVRQFPRTDKIGSLETFWTKRIWQKALEDAARIAAIDAGTRSSQEIQVVLDVQRENKTEFQKSNFSVTNYPLWTDIPADDPDLNAGWDGTRVEDWRFKNSYVWWFNLAVIPYTAAAIHRRADTTLADWVTPWVDLSRIRLDRGSWNRLWYAEVDASAVPRNWLREVLPWIQLATKIGSGNPRDVQHSSYLFDSDVFVTADRRYAAALDLARASSPRPFAEVRTISADGSTVENLARVLATT
jgi:hypothetical protein